MYMSAISDITFIYFQDHEAIKFSESDKKNLLKNLAELKTEMSIDTKQLSEQNKIKTLLVTKGILDKKLQQIQGENRNLDVNLKDEHTNLEKLRNEIETLEEEIRQLDAVEIKDTSKKYGNIIQIQTTLFEI